MWCTGDSAASRVRHGVISKVPPIPSDQCIAKFKQGLQVATLWVITMMVRWGPGYQCPERPRQTHIQPCLQLSCWPFLYMENLFTVLAFNPIHLKYKKYTSFYPKVHLYFSPSFFVLLIKNDSDLTIFKSKLMHCKQAQALNHIMFSSKAVPRQHILKSTFQYKFSFSFILELVCHTVFFS